MLLDSPVDATVPPIGSSPLYLPCQHHRNEPKSSGFRPRLESVVALICRRQGLKSFVAALLFFGRLFHGARHLPAHFLCGACRGFARSFVYCLTVRRSRCPRSRRSSISARGLGAFVRTFARDGTCY